MQIILAKIAYRKCNPYNNSNDNDKKYANLLRLTDVLYGPAIQQVLTRSLLANGNCSYSCQEICCIETFMLVNRSKFS